VPSDEFTIDHYADFGSGEPWVARTFLGLNDIVAATKWTTETTVRDALGDVFETLADAFTDLLELRTFEGRDIPVTKRRSAYSAFYRHLWTAYKDRFPIVATALGYDIGFLFQKDKDFEKVSPKFLARHPELPPELIVMLRDERASWQSGLMRFRNDHLEHRKPLEESFVAPFYTLAMAELAFENVWQAIEDITIQLLVPHIPPAVQLVEIPEADRDPTIPKRFTFALRPGNEP
jgi:hypothetical protein